MAPKLDRGLQAAPPSPPSMLSLVPCHAAHVVKHPDKVFSRWCRGLDFFPVPCTGSDYLLAYY